MKFKQYFLFSAFTIVAYANGFKVQEQSLNGTALNSAYIAGSRGADASYYNPANMGFKNDWVNDINSKNLIGSGENKYEFEMSLSFINIPGFDLLVPSTNQGLNSTTTLEYQGLAKVGKDLLSAIGKIFGLDETKIKETGKTFAEAKIPEKVYLQHSLPDSLLVKGDTKDTNFILPKFFFKSKNYNGLTFGASFVAPSGLGMNWNGKGGEFLQDVFIFLVEGSTPVSYTYNDRFSIGFAPRMLYGMGKFNNTVYVPLGTTKTPGCTPTIDPQILKDLPNGIVPDEMVTSLQGLADASSGLALINLSQGSTQLEVIKKMVKSISTCVVGTSKVEQKSDGADFGFGYRASLSFRIGNNGMFSTVYNSPVDFKFGGSLDANTIIGGPVGSVRMQTTLDLYITMPEILTIAYSHDFNRFRLEGVYERTFWSKGRKFDIAFDTQNAKFSASSGSVAQSFSQQQLQSMIGLADFDAVAMGKGWSDTDTFRLGLTYMGKNLRVMISAVYDKSPVKQDQIGIPDSDGYGLGFGLKYRFRGFDLGFALSNTYKENRQSIYFSEGIGALRIATASVGYRW